MREVMGKKRATRRESMLSADVVEARSIALVDESGRRRLSLSCIEGEKGVLTIVDLNDEKGRPRITLQVDHQGNPSLILFTPGGGLGVSLALTSTGNGISIADAEGRPCIMAGVPSPDSGDPRGPGPKLDVIDESGKRTWSVFEGTVEHSE